MYAFEFHTERLKGEIMRELLDLVEKKIVRVIDLVIIQKYEDGSHQALEMEEIAPNIMSIFDPLDVEISGIVQVEDIEAIAAAMDKDTTAAVLLVENLWSIKFAEAIVRADGQLLLHDRIPFEVINETIEIFAAAEAEA
jgi:hypothetical protein